MRISDWSSDVCSSDLILEDVAEVAAAAPAVHLRAGQEEAVVLPGADGVRQRLPEARPAGAAVVLVLRRIGGEVAAPAVVEAGALLLQERAAARPLGRLLAQHGLGLGTQQAAPILLALRHLRSEERRVGKEGVRTG